MTPPSFLCTNPKVYEDLITSTALAWLLLGPELFPFTWKKPERWGRAHACTELLNGIKSYNFVSVWFLKLYIVGSLCINYLSHCCDKMPDKKKLKKGWVCFGSQFGHVVRYGGFHGGGNLNQLGIHCICVQKAQLIPPFFFSPGRQPMVPSIVKGVFLSQPNWNNSSHVGPEVCVFDYSGFLSMAILTGQIAQ